MFFCLLFINNAYTYSIPSIILYLNTKHVPTIVLYCYSEQCICHSRENSLFLDTATDNIALKILNNVKNAKQTSSKLRELIREFIKWKSFHILRKEVIHYSFELVVKLERWEYVLHLGSPLWQLYRPGTHVASGRCPDVFTWTAPTVVEFSWLSLYTYFKVGTG